jgi:hypothetical protein
MAGRKQRSPISPGSAFRADILVIARGDSTGLARRIIV